MTGTLVLNAVFGVAVVTALVGSVAWAIRTQHQDASAHRPQALEASPSLDRHREPVARRRHDSRRRVARGARLPERRVSTSHGSRT